ncbi:MAG TPA: S53 family peptidase [Candidatus Cybelea sp.]|jgi:subtilase family serine protease
MQDLGRATDTTQVSVAVVLNYRNEDQLDQLIEAQGTPGSGSFHHFLTPQQFARRFGPTEADYQATIGQLRDAGFTITHTFTNRTTIDASAPAPVAERLFSTEIHVVRRPDGLMAYRNVRPETIPASLARTVVAVVGLDSATSMRPQYVFKSGHHVVPSVLVRRTAKPPLFGPDNGYGPQIYRINYKFPKKLTGQKRASAFVGNADFLDTDVSGYLSYFEVNRTGPATKRVLVDGGPPQGISEDSVEATLDIETLVSIAPGTAIYAYEVPFSATLEYFTDAYTQLVQDDFADTVNTSYSECETAFTVSFPKASNHIFKQGAAEGITFHASSGDSGDHTYGCEGSPPSVGTPTDDPVNISIGGTTMFVDRTSGKETSELGWGGSGGGVSVVFKLPKYQKGVTNIITTGRNLPDLSFDSDPNTGESFYFEGAFQGPIGGTSLGSPIFGAGLTVIDQMQNSRAGYFNPALYSTWEKDGYKKGKTVYLRDITSGNNGGFSAGPGYDQMSGIGAMIFGNFGPLLK